MPTGTSLLVSPVICLKACPMRQLKSGGVHFRFHKPPKEGRKVLSLASVMERAWWLTRFPSICISFLQWGGASSLSICRYRAPVTFSWTNNTTLPCCCSYCCHKGMQIPFNWPQGILLDQCRQLCWFTQPSKWKCASSGNAKCTKWCESPTIRSNSLVANCKQFSRFPSKGYSPNRCVWFTFKELLHSCEFSSVWSVHRRCISTFCFHQSRTPFVNGLWMRRIFVEFAK